MTPPLIPAERLDLAGLIRPGDTVVCGQGTAEPRDLTEILVRQARVIGPVRVVLGPTFSGTFGPDAPDTLSFASYGGMGRTSRLARAGRLDVMPAHYSELPDLVAAGALRADVVLIQLPPDDAGRPSLGLADDYVAAAARTARVVIAEVNRHVPWTYGADASPAVPVHHAVEGARPPLELAPSAGGEAERAIAARVADLVPDGATLQIGIGAVPDAILAALGHHRDLGIHSGLIGDRVADLVEAGAVTNARKPTDPGVTACGLLFGTDRLYRFAHRNPALRVCPTHHTHGREVLARLPRFTSINSAIEVDLTGQVNAEVAGGVYCGGVGGQVDFARAAAVVPGGRAIIALPATARGGEVSRIVAALSGPATTARSDADTIVTEWGVAELKGQTLRERVRRMIAVAAPAFRDDLARAARALG